MFFFGFGLRVPDYFGMLLGKRKNFGTLMAPWRAVDVDAHNGGVEVKKMEPWRFCRPVVVDSHHFDKELDPDPDPH
jgi:hypothetical protein